MNKGLSALVATAGVVASLLVAAPAAHARCDNPYVSYIEITSKKGYHIGKEQWHFKDGPGGKMTAEAQNSGKVSASVTVGLKSEIKAIVAAAEVSVSGTVTNEVGVTVGHKYEHGIRAGKYGHLRYGSWGYAVGWARYESTPDRCRVQVLRSGKANVPTSAKGWKFWETSS